MKPAGQTWKALLARAAGAFTSPSFALFVELLSAWACATGRRTICGMVAVMGPGSRRAHDAYHRLVRAGKWDLAALWTAMVALVAAHLSPEEAVVCLIDDTPFHRPARKVEGAGSYRDAVLPPRAASCTPGGCAWSCSPSGSSRPGAGCPSRYRSGSHCTEKAGRSSPNWPGVPRPSSPGGCPGGVSSSVPTGPTRPWPGPASPARPSSRACEETPPSTARPQRARGKKGRPRQRGERLPSPERLAARARKWESVEVPWGGRTITRLTWSRRVLW